MESGTLRQLLPDEEQIVDGEPQLPSRPSSPLVELEQEEKRTVPLPVAARPPLPTQEEVAEQQAYQQLYGGPVMKINRYSGTDLDWVELVGWNVPIGYTGDLQGDNQPAGLVATCTFYNGIGNSSNFIILQMFP